MTAKDNIGRIVAALCEAHEHALRSEAFGGHLVEALPIRTITGIDLRGERKIGVVLTEVRGGRVRSPREMYTEAGLALGWFSILQSPYFNPVKGLHYLDVLEGLPFVRIMVGAKAGEHIRLGSNHRLLLPEVFTVGATQRYTTDARPRAIEQALAAWDDNADRLGLAAVLPRDRYEQALREALALFDARHGHLLKRPVLQAA